MARPRPIIIPALSQEIEGPGQAQLGQALGQLVAAFAGRAMERGQERGAQEAFRGAFPGLFPTQQVEAAGPRLPAGGVEEVGIAEEGAPLAPAPTAEVVPQNIQALTNLLSLTPEGRARGQQLAAQVGLEQAMPKAPSERKITKDVAGRQRFIDTGELVFPEVQTPLKAGETLISKIDPTHYTGESLDKFKESNRFADLEFSKDHLNKIATGDGKKFDKELKLQDRFVKQSAPFVGLQSAYTKVKSASRAKSAAGDISLIFGYMKMLDPTSTVREGEAATVENARGVPDTVLSLYNKVITGEKLSDPQREDFSDRAKDLFDIESERHKKRVNIFEGLAKQNELDRNNIVLDLTDPLFEAFKEGTVEAPALPEGAEVLGTSGGKEVIRVGGKTFIRE